MDEYIFVFPFISFFVLLIHFAISIHTTCFVLVCCCCYSGYIIFPLISPYSEELDICIYEEHFVFKLRAGKIVGDTSLYLFLLFFFSVKYSERLWCIRGRNKEVVSLYI